MTIFFYGKLRERFGTAVELEIPAAGCSIAALRERLAERLPAVALDLQSRTVRACVGDEIVLDDFVVAPGQDVEFFPPLSGG